MPQRGYTLIGLVIAMGLAAVLAAAAVPSFSRLHQEARLTGTAERLFTDLTHARTQAILRQRPVAVVAARDGWQAGWSVFVDHNRNRIRDAAETLLRQAPALPPGYTLTANAGIGGAIGYRGDGRTERPSGGLQMGTWLLCDERGRAVPDHARVIIVSATGRPRIGQRSDALDGQRCD